MPSHARRPLARTTPNQSPTTNLFIKKNAKPTSKSAKTTVDNNIFVYFVSCLLDNSFMGCSSYQLLIKEESPHALRAVAVDLPDQFIIYASYGAANRDNYDNAL